VTVHGFGRADGDFVGVFAKHLPDRTGFLNIARQRGSAVSVDVVYILGLQARIAQGIAYRARLSVCIRFGDVLRIGTGVVTG